MKFGYPYQYNQAPLKKILFFLNVVLRMKLNKFLPQFFSLNAFTLIANHEYSYSEILKKVNKTTRNIYVSLFGIFSILFFILKSVLVFLKKF
jgi:hypothetical protein